MCGLAGFYRDPSVEGGKDALAAFLSMLEVMESRGRDATGFAILYDDGRIRIEKMTAPASQAIRHKDWESLFSKLNMDRVVGIIGHTRASSVMGTAAMQDAAHPFRIGKVVGAHNGMIHNWRDLAKNKKKETNWLVDSEAAFAMIDDHDDPIDALNKLTGYWALTWFKGGRLHFTRAHGAPLHVAYVGHARTLLWCSTERPLKSALRDNKWEANSEWEPDEGYVYQYFAPKLAETTASGLKSKKAVASRSRASAADLAVTSGRGGDHRTMLPGWRNRWPDKRSVQTPLFPEDRLAELESTVETLKAEIEHLYKVMNSFDMFDGLEDDTPDDSATCTICGRERGAYAVVESDSGSFIHVDCVTPDLL